MKSLRFLLFLALILPTLAFANDCLAILQKLTGHIEIYQGFNVTSFKVKKAYFIEELSRNNRINLNNYQTNSAEEFLALAEAYRQLIDPNGTAFETILEHGPSRKQRQLLHSIGHAKTGKMNFLQVSNQIENLYKLINFGSDNFFQHTFSRIKNSFSLEKAIKQRVGSAFLKQSMEDALLELGFFKSSRMLNRFRQWKVTRNIIMNSAQSAALNMMSLKLFSNAPLMPELDILRNINLSEEIYELVQKNGIDAAYPLLKEKYGRLTTFELVYEKMRLVYMFGSYYLFSLFMGDDGYLAPADKYINGIEYDEDSFSRYDYISQLHIYWMFQFKYENERDPTDEEDKAHWNQLEDLSIEQLQFKLENLLDRSPSSVPDERINNSFIKFSPAFWWRF